ncbi:MAG: phosphoribosylglycinamide formyltransferase, partial [Methanomicrobiales archaeon]|nr:phosphoribosylglycinamide formyltransferase [Methanomicrobiales archaeon]
MKRIAVLASGRGSNFQAIIKGIQSGRIPAECVCLITDNPRAYAVSRASMAGIPTKILNYSGYPNRKEY